MVRAHDPSDLATLLAEDAIFYSPIVPSPQRGRELATLYLTAAFQVFFNPTFRYVREIVGPSDAMLEFETEIDGIVVNGVDLIKWSEELDRRGPQSRTSPNPRAGVAPRAARPARVELGARADCSCPSPMPPRRFPPPNAGRDVPRERLILRTDARSIRPSPGSAARSSATIRASIAGTELTRCASISGRTTPTRWSTRGPRSPQASRSATNSPPPFSGN